MKNKSHLTFSTILITTIILLASFFISIQLFAQKTFRVSIIKTFFSLDSLKKYNNQVNILFLGIAGGSHDGSTLSDSIIFCNYNFVTNTLTTISIPRDIWSDTLKDKVNSAYAYGEAKIKGGGIKLAKAEIEGIVGQPIHYAAVVDFDRFKELVDFFGGIKVQVESSFTDTQFPIEGKENDLCGGSDPEYKCRYETIFFTKGVQNMDGITALKYVRSRHALGEEGGDFSREKRQQAVIEALKQSAISLLKSFNFSRVNKLYALLDSIVQRDITNQQVAIIIKNILLKNKLELQKYVLDDNFFITPEYSSLYDGKWVLIPSTNSYAEIQSYIACLLDGTKNCSSLKDKGEKNK